MPKVPEGAKQPADRLAAEAANADSEHVVPFKGKDIRVKAFLDWDKRAIQHINVLNLDAWAAAALHAEDVKLFVDAEATMGEALAFAKSCAASAGADLGEAGASLVS